MASSLRATRMISSRKSPGGSTLVSPTMRRRLARSLSMLAATPGYCTFMTTGTVAPVSGSATSARCTCPMEAAAMGRSSKLATPWRSRQPSPSSAVSWACSCADGIMSAPWRARSRAAASGGGSMRSSWMDSICPSLSAAPRMRHSVSARASAEASGMPSPPPRARFVARRTPSMPKPHARASGVDGTSRSTIFSRSLAEASSALAASLAAASSSPSPAS
mmetsp:Transcript_8673/g.29597  ORF Transcript_8673/g.29597 Transcript_8673/m.29597 type:complete len:220 (+) Transcript_8673:1568-2227(+)